MNALQLPGQGKNRFSRQMSKEEAQQSLDGHKRSAHNGQQDPDCRACKELSERVKRSG